MHGIPREDRTILESQNTGEGLLEITDFLAVTKLLQGQPPKELLRLTPINLWRLHQQTFTANN
jgi:hypothetical protein